jgi:hypothetical protein
MKRPPSVNGRYPETGHIMAGMAEWWSIEVFDGELQAASRWKDAYSSALIESAISSGALEWAWIEHRSGVVFEACFPDDAQWEAFRRLPATAAALDAVPDRINGLLVYRGRGGGAGSRSPRRPRPTAGAGAVELPEPKDERVLDLTAVAAPGPVRDPAVAAPGPFRDLCPAE